MCQMDGGGGANSGAPRACLVTTPPSPPALTLPAAPLDNTAKLAGAAKPAPGKNGTAKAPEVFNLFKLFTGMQHSDEKLQQIVANVMQRYPKGITFADFEQLFCVADVAKMTLNL